MGGFRDSRNSNSSHESAISFPWLAVVKYVCCSLVLYCTPVSCCIALFSSAQTWCAINQTRHWVSVMPRPLVKPPLIFMHRTRTCSMTRAGESPAQNRSGFRDSRNSNSSHESAISFPCLAVVKYVCCSLVLYCTPVSCCIALFSSAQTGCINQTRH